MIDDGEAWPGFCLGGSPIREPTLPLILRTTDMKHAAAATNVNANRAMERRTKLRLRELCDEVLASYHQARGHELFSSDDRETARGLITSVVNPR